MRSSRSLALLQSRKRICLHEDRQAKVLTHEVPGTFGRASVEGERASAHRWAVGRNDGSCLTARRHLLVRSLALVGVERQQPRSHMPEGFLYRVQTAFLLLWKATVIHRPGFSTRKSSRK
jgi:hypothetical protein